MRHLLGGCKRCLAVLAPTAGALAPAGEPEPATLDDFDLPIRRAFEAVARHGVEAPEIRAATRKLRHRMATKGLESFDMEAYPDHAVFEALLQRIQDLRHEDPKSMVQHGYMALQIARAMANGCDSKEEHADLQSRAMAELANAMRVADDLHEAGKTLDLAEQWYAAGTRCDLLWLRLLDVRASLYGAQQHYQDAIGLLAEVLKGRLLLGDRTGAARALIGQGIFTAYTGQHEAAFGHFDRALSLIDSFREPSLAALAYHNRLLFTIDLGNFKEALDYLESNRQQLMHSGGRLDGVKLLGLEARIQTGLGQFDLAETLLREAKLGLVELELKGHEALAGLDLATVILHQDRDRYTEAVTLAVEALRTFTQLQVKPQVVEALHVLAHAVKDGIVTASLLQSIADFVRKAEHDRRARYQPRFE